MLVKFSAGCTASHPRRLLFCILYILVASVIGFRTSSYESLTLAVVSLRITVGVGSNNYEEQMSALQFSPLSEDSL
jgi:hypothetical protein